MSQVDLERIQNDLDSIKEVIRRDRPYSAGDVLLSVVIGVGAVFCMGLLHWRVFSDPRFSFFLSLSPGIALWVRRYLQTYRGRAKRPVLWKEYKWGHGCFGRPSSNICCLGAVASPFRLQSRIDSCNHSFLHWSGNDDGWNSSP